MFYRITRTSCHKVEISLQLSTLMLSIYSRIALAGTCGHMTAICTYLAYRVPVQAGNEHRTVSDREYRLSLSESLDGRNSKASSRQRAASDTHPSTLCHDRGEGRRETECISLCVMANTRGGTHCSG